MVFQPRANHPYARAPRFPEGDVTIDELLPGPGPFEIEILDADPRRVKKLKIYRRLDRPRGVRDPRRRPGDADKAAAATAPPTTPPELPVSGDESVKLSPDAAPSKSARRP